MFKKFIKLLILNISIVAGVVFTYSEGFLCLRPTDASIFRAGMSIFVGIAAGVAFCYGNYTILMDDSQGMLLSKDEIVDISQARSVLSSFSRSRFFGRLAGEAADQLGRLEYSMDRATKAIGLKFQPGSMAYDRYISTIQSAREAALLNSIGIANRMQIFNDKEYERLKTYQADRIDDGIQEKQIALYQKNMEQIQSAVSANEELMLALDTMSLQLAGADAKKNEDSALLEEISKLTDQVRLYT